MDVIMVGGAIIGFIFGGMVWDRDEREWSDATKVVCAQSQDHSAQHSMHDCLMTDFNRRYDATFKGGWKTTTKRFVCRSCKRKATQ